MRTQNAVVADPAYLRAAREITTAAGALLVPATMEMMGKWNWWLPRPLERLLISIHVPGVVPRAGRSQGRADTTTIAARSPFTASFTPATRMAAVGMSVVWPV